MKCPWCSLEASRRKKGCCPNCGREVFIYKTRTKQTIWVAAKPSTVALVQRLETHVQKTLPEFSLSDNYVAQLACAKTLLEKCNVEQRLAELVIDSYFLGINGLYKAYNMFGVIGKRLPHALAVAKKMYRKEQDQQTQQQERAKVDKLDVYYAL